MTLEDVMNLRNTLDRKQRSRISNRLRVMDNIVRGLYDKEDDPLKVAQEDLDLMNGDKVL